MVGGSSVDIHADHVGSLLRPARLQEARAAFDAALLSREDLTQVEDSEIEAAVAMQRDAGLASFTDGEFRRAYWHYDFLAGLAGIELQRIPDSERLTSGFVHRHRMKVQERVVWRGEHAFLKHFAFLHKIAGSRARQAIPSPSVVHFRLGQSALQSGAYKNLDTLLDDLAEAYKHAVESFAAAGCRFLQIDEVNLAMLCDPAQVREAEKRGVLVPDLASRYAELINHAIGGRPADMRIGLHLCRGNFQSTWIAQGGYEPVADLLFNKLDVDVYFMEYDSERAGDFAPLRYLPKGQKQVVLGLVTSKSGELEDRHMIESRIYEASKVAPLNQLSLSPQCGFASTEEGNSLGREEQWAKLQLCAEIARSVWPASEAAALRA